MSNDLEKLIQRAQQAVAKGKNDIAKKCYLQALTLRPTMPNLHYGLATVYYLQNDLENAVEHFQQVTQLDPLRAGAFINLGAVYNKLDRLDEAIKALRKGIQLDLNRPEGYYNLGLVYRKRGQSDMAIQAYREATRVAPRMADAHYNLANLYLEKEQLNLAITHYEQALELRPNWTKAHQGLEAAREALDDDALEEIDNEATAFEDDEAPTQRMLDPERVIDPQIHGILLNELHRATKDSEKLGRQFANVVQNEIEPALKLLSSCLLYSDRSATELDQCVRKVEVALSHMSQTQKVLQAHMAKVKENGNKLLES